MGLRNKKILTRKKSCSEFPTLPASDGERGRARESSLGLRSTHSIRKQKAFAHNSPYFTEKSVVLISYYLSYHFFGFCQDQECQAVIFAHKRTLSKYLRPFKHIFIIFIMVFDIVFTKMYQQKRPFINSLCTDFLLK